LTRANAVRDEIVKYAKSKSIVLDESQFATVGHGFLSPKTGMCGKDPCAPKTEAEWRNNMRVEFRIIQIEAESDVFKPL
jgi:outer membrane protein OmpA-like peptidoglycan-associated protein